MARTKKYLISSKGARSRPGFYRPLKRLKNAENIAGNASVPTSTLLPVQNYPQSEDSGLDPKVLPSLQRKTYDELDYPRPQTTSGGSEATAGSDNLDFTNHDVNEKITLLEKQLNNAINKESQFKDDIAELKASLAHERKELESTIKTLRHDVEQFEPIQQNKFFTISKELQEVVTAMNHLIETENNTLPQSTTSVMPGMSALNPATAIASAPVVTLTPTLTPTPTPPAVVPAAVPAPDSLQPTPTPTVTPTPTPVIPADSTPTPAPAVTPAAPTTTNTKIKIPKPLIILGLTFLIVGLIGGSAWMFINRKTEVNSTLIQEYLPKTDSPNASPQAEEKKIDSSNTQNQAQTKGASDNKYTESQADVPFSDSKWDTLKDPSFGVEINYPNNAVNVIKTDSSITFIRKTGYIFKVQLIETALSVQEYWKMVSASSLKYKIKETTFRDNPALYMELEDFSEYPGDKYLVKNGKYIYDIWYATYSNTLSDDDAKRIDIMLNSFKFTPVINMD